MRAVLVNFRRSMHTQHCNKIVLKVDNVDSREKAQSLVGKPVVWTSPGKQKKEIKGKITAPHGNKGCVRVLFERGLPGQAMGTELTISDIISDVPASAK